MDVHERIVSSSYVSITLSLSRCLIDQAAKKPFTALTLHNAPTSQSRAHAGAMSPLAICAVVAACLWSSVAIALSVSESLWLDELHSTWSASGTFDEVAARAALGNQLSPYFYMLWTLGQTVGTAEIVWRGPSICAWIAAVVLTGWILGRIATHLRTAMIMGALALVACDRMHIFYATEARPYALLSLSTLMSWLALQRWSEACYRLRCQGSGLSPLNAFIAWCVLIVVSFWLQPTALLSIAAQFAFLIGLASWWLAKRAHFVSGDQDQSGDDRWPVRKASVTAVGPIALGGLVLVAAAWPAHSLLRPVWEHRHLWAGFAAGHGLRDVLGLLPLTAFLVPLLLGTVISRFAAVMRRNARGSGRADTAGTSGQDDTERALSLKRQWWMWLCAWLVPCCLLYLLTVSGVAPLMHPRYVFAAAFPFVIWVAHSWIVFVTGTWLRGCALAAMLAMLLSQQGSFDVWRRGGWPAAVRGEDWRGAVELINSHSSTRQPRIVLCASNLIEGRALPAGDEGLRHYLSLPLRSIYRVEPPAELVPLANDARTWPQSLRAASDAAERAGGDTDIEVWLLVRSSVAGLDRRLRTSGLQGGRRHDFGGVQAMSNVSLSSVSLSRSALDVIPP